MFPSCHLLHHLNFQQPNHYPQESEYTRGIVSCCLTEGVILKHGRVRSWGSLLSLLAASCHGGIGSLSSGVAGILRFPLPEPEDSDAIVTRMTIINHDQES